MNARVGKMCVAAMSLCMIVLIVTRKRGDGRYYFALWQSNNNTPNKLLLSDSAVSCLLRVRSVSFTSRAKECIKFVPHSCLVSLSHKVGVFLKEAIYYFIGTGYEYDGNVFVAWVLQVRRMEVVTKWSTGFRTYFTEINHVLLASRGYEYDGFLDFLNSIVFISFFERDLIATFVFNC